MALNLILDISGPGVPWIPTGCRMIGCKGEEVFWFDSSSHCVDLSLLVDRTPPGAHFRGTTSTCIAVGFLSGKKLCCNYCKITVTQWQAQEQVYSAIYTLS